jgi:hypothetical protein
MKPLIDEQILADIPDELIRPLLAMCMRVLLPNTIVSYKQLLKESRRLDRASRIAPMSSLAYFRLERMATIRLDRLQEAQDWAQKSDPAAEVTLIGVNRWIVNTRIHGEQRPLFVEHQPIGVYRSRTVITEANERDTFWDA